MENILRTKLVYVLVSSDNDIYHEQALLSTWSAKHWNPNACIVLVMDDKTSVRLDSLNSELLSLITEKKVVDFPPEMSGRLRSRELKTSLRNLVDGDFLFIDADTIICGSLAEVDGFEMQIGSVLDGHRKYDKNFHHHLTQAASWLDCQINEGMSYYNSGVMYVKDTYETHRFYKSWHDLYEKLQKEGHFFDQPSLFEICQKQQIVKEIDGLYNCQLFLGGLPFIGDAKIIHTFNDLGLPEFGNQKQGQVYDPNKPKAFYKLAETNFLLKIKQQGRLLEEDKQVILTAKRQFYGEYKLMFGHDLDFYHSAFYHLFMKMPRKFKVFEMIAKIALRFGK